MGDFILVAFIFLILIWPVLRSAVIFPLPLRDSGGMRYGSWPWMTVILISINTLLFFTFQGSYFRALFGSSEYDAMQGVYDFYKTIYFYGWRSEYLVEGTSIGPFVSMTHMFMHGDMAHLFGNMAYLWAFGRRIEDSMGPWRFLAFYLLAGFVAGVGSELLWKDTFDVPGIGASGAISGVLGAYLILFPGAKVDCLWGIGLLPRLAGLVIRTLFGSFDDDDKDPKDEPRWRWTVKIPAWMLLIFFAVNNILPSFELIQGSRDQIGGTNTIAHMTGFLAAITVFLFVRKDLLTRYLAGRRL